MALMNGDSKMRARIGLLLLIPTLLGFAVMVAIVQTRFTSTAFADDVVPFKIQVPDAVLEDLKHRLEQARFADEIPDANWDYGTNAAYLKALVGYWRDEYDWRAQERRLNQFDQFKTSIDVVLPISKVGGKGPHQSTGWGTCRALRGNEGILRETKLL
jgi:hypothetical protein